MAVTWWHQWKHGAEAAAMQLKLQWLEAESKFHRQRERAFRALDLEDPEHRKAFELLRSISSSWPFASVQQRPVGSPQCRLEVLLFHYDSHSSPGSIISVAILLRNQKAVDLVLRESDGRTESREVKLEAANEQSDVRLVLDCTPGVYSPKTSEPFTITYTVSNQGFDQIE